jgi:hypothetical protein
MYIKNNKATKDKKKSPRKEPKELAKGMHIIKNVAKVWKL